MAHVLRSQPYKWHTYYGAGTSAADEVGYGIAVAPDGSTVYLTGSAPDTWLGDGNTAPLQPFSGGAGFSTDIVVLKLNASGSYQWHTFYGASETDDFGYGIAVDGDNNPYVTGYSFLTWGTPLHAHGNVRDIAVLKLNANGAHQWHTFYGSDGNDIGTAIALDSSSNPYITGWSTASWQGDADASPSHPYSGDGNTNITVLKLNSSGGYQRHTFYGASGHDNESLSIALDSTHGVLTTGSSAATWQGDGDTNPLHPHSGNLEGDGFVLKLSNRVYNVYVPLIIQQ
ncbi:SBBP repeat-containing protein [Candidatus Chloroploca sp. Khr17]|uniref:SBBP repeat-containing protein n=1 Tax=Candidatus Chloroploca sp. Khr17 TaxID=2496869 RepID=UPI001F0E3A73|nr:SBBP repeat-containing protein [Candidatus Chloroploca sp. Khr17]